MPDFEESRVTANITTVPTHVIISVAPVLRKIPLGKPRRTNGLLCVSAYRLFRNVSGCPFRKIFARIRMASDCRFTAPGARHLQPSGSIVGETDSIRHCCGAHVGISASSCPTQMVSSLSSLAIGQWSGGRTDTGYRHGAVVTSGTGLFWLLGRYPRSPRRMDSPSCEGFASAYPQVSSARYFLQRPAAFRPPHRDNPQTTHWFDSRL